MSNKIDIEKLAIEAELNIPSQTWGEVYVKLKAFAEAYASEKQRQQEPVAKINAQWSCPDSLGKKHRERYVQFKNGIIPQEGTELFTYPPDAAKVLEDKEREITELKENLNTELKRGGSYKILVKSLEGELEHYRSQDYTLSKARLDTLEQSLNSEREMNEILTNENTELQAHINDLREALDEANGLNINWSSDAEPHTLEYFSEYKRVIKMGKKALSKTPAQSLQEHDNELIERCAEIVENMHGCGWNTIAEQIRRLKGN